MLRFVESFDHYPTGQSGPPFKWDGTFDQFFSVTSTGRFGVYRGQCSPTSLGGYKNFTGTEATWIIGFAVLLFGYSNGQPLVLAAGHEIGGPRHIWLGLNSVGRLTVMRGTSTTLATCPTIIPLNQWRYVEFKFTVDDTVGAYEVRIDGVTEVSATGVDTREGGTGYVDRINFCGGQGTGDTATASLAFDDIYICDGVDSGVAGCPNDDFLGDVRVEALFPTGNGNSSDFVGSDANSTDNYLLVDEVAYDDDTTYVESSNVSDEDTYTYSDLISASGTVYGAQMLPRARKTDTGLRSICSVTRLGATEEDSADKALNVSYDYFPDIREADPDGDQWTIANVNAAEFGQKVTV